MKCHYLGFIKHTLVRGVGIATVLPDVKIALRFRGLGCGGRFFFSFQVGRKAQMLGALGTKLTKHYIATWPSVGIKWWLFSMMLH